jgi:hypothetical protein
MTESDPRLLQLHPDDNIVVLCASIEAGETILVSGQAVELTATIFMGHKLACQVIRAGEKVLKYGAPIGSATEDIAVGEHVHLSNLKSDYTATYSLQHEGGADDA